MAETLCGDRVAYRFLQAGACEFFTILRPLVGIDKQEIIDQARRIGTFDISSIPDQDCCQLFVPKYPATKAALPTSKRTS